MKGRLAAAVLGVLLVVGGASCTTIRSRIWMNEGNKLYKAERYDEAIGFYKKIVAIDPNNWTANYLIAMSNTAMYHTGSTHPKDIAAAEEATKAFEKLLTLHAPDKDTEEKVRNYYVAVLRASDKTDKVIAYYEGLLKQDPRNTGLMGQLAEIYAKKGDFDNAYKYYVKRTEIEPKNKEFWYTIGVLCWDRAHNFGATLPVDEQMKTIDLGIAALEKAIAIDPNYFDGLVYINLIYREKASALGGQMKQLEAGDAFAKAEEYKHRAEEIGKKRTAEAAAKKGA